MHANTFRADVAASPGFDNGDAGNGQGKKSQHSPWTASKPRKKTNRTQLEAMDNYDELTIAENDENQMPMAKAGGDSSADMQMLTDGMKALRVFRKASGVKGAVHLRQNRGNPLLASLNLPQASMGSLPDQDKGGLSASFSSASMLFSGASTLHTAASCPVFLDGLQARLEQPGAAFKPGFHPTQQSVDAVAAGAPSATDLASCQITPPSQPLSVSLHAGHSCEMPREVERLADLHALSADATSLRSAHLSASYLSQRPEHPTSDEAGAHHHHHKFQSEGGQGSALLSSTTISSQPSAGMTNGLFAPSNTTAAAAAALSASVQGVDVQGLRGHGVVVVSVSAAAAGPARVAGAPTDEVDDTSFMHLLSHQLHGDDADVWGGEEDFRIMTRPLRASGTFDDGHGWCAWDATTPKTGQAGASAATAPAFPFTTPRTSAAGAAATTPHATIRTGLSSDNGCCPGSSSMMMGSGQVVVHQYGRLGYASAASTGGEAGPGKGRGMARRAPTPAGHLLGRAMSDWDDEEGDEDGEEEGGSGRVHKEDNVPSAPLRQSQRRVPRDTRDTPDGTPAPGLHATPSSPHQHARAGHGAAGHVSQQVTGSGLLKAAAKSLGQLAGSTSHHQRTPSMKARGSAAASPRSSILDTPDTAKAGSRRFCNGFLDSGRRGSRDSVARQAQEEAALANLMCDECDFCTPPHSPRGNGLPVWAHGSEVRSELRRTRSADEIMMSRDLAHPITCPGGDINVATSCQLQHACGAGGEGGFGHYGMHPACSYDEGLMELHAHGGHGSRAGHPHATSLPHPHHVLYPDTDIGVSGWSLSSAFAYGDGSWAKSSRAGGGSGGGHMGGAEGVLLRCEEVEVMQAPVVSLDTLEEFNTQLSLAAERGDQSRAERLWGELRSRCLLPDMRTLNMLMRCLCKGVIDPDAAEELMCEVCSLGGLQPNATTFTLLAEIRHRYEQLTAAH